ncbi:hypothetical protein CI109_106392 [Kwoniella shandongensis]|uniref:Uncharacterized protein n=1 Tax=Kwoniella shandongensis TaxID=1734106 RepID=A0A5M6BSG3_9TREE|nr:uncharacterized protein CI109_005900 [Kwoniella shandongensis]KAA5525737.1 hypothetical protein CI109_005900 [Kwoniella shandongensis]
MSEPALRRRTTQPSSTPVTSYQRAPPPPRRGHPTRSLHLSLALVILAFFVVYAQRQTVKPKAPLTYSVDDQRQLPEKYAICSKDGKKVYTVPIEGGVGGVECVVVDGKEVVDTGSLGKIRRKWINGEDGQKPLNQFQVLYLAPGQTLTPGLIDAHGHPLVYGQAQQLTLYGCRSPVEVIERVEAFVKASPPPPGTWIEGLGWDQNLFEGQEFPTAAEFAKSSLLKDLPISLSRVDFHVEWVSPAILKMLGDIPDVDGGQVVRDADGKPTGVFVDNAIELLKAIRPPWTDADRERYLDIMVKDALSKGLTGVHDAQGFLEDQQFFIKMAKERKLPMRFYSMLACGREEDFCGDKIEHFDDPDGHYTLRAVKMFADGALGSRGAALTDDYSDKPGWNGLMLKKEEVWEPLIKKWYEAGWQVNVHTIGDRAAKTVLDAIESTFGSDPDRGREARFRLEHAQILRPEDIARAAKLGVIGSYQPTHATSDMWYAEDRIGSERIKGAYAWRTYLNHGGRIALGSDFPVESIDPLKGYYAAVTRLSEDGRSPHGPGGWFPAEKLTREEALRGMTIDAAYASFSENLTGSLTVGKRFDATIWDDDLLTVPENEMLEVKAKGVIVDGKLVWGGVGA